MNPLDSNNDQWTGIPEVDRAHLVGRAMQAMNHDTPAPAVDQPPAPWAFRVVAATIVITITVGLFLGPLVAMLFAVAGLATAAALKVDPDA